ncbi:MAG: hypothetical protein RLZZ21_295 [Planctomycetota bacterium]|jgi:hypothetical protein
MPIVTLRYTLPEEQADFDAARQGAEARSLIWDIDQRCRSVIKYGAPSEETARLAEEIREMIGASKMTLD